MRSTTSSKTDFLRRLCPAARHFPVELVAADLLQPDGWPAAVAGCAYVLHVASPFTIVEPADADALIKPAVDGTLHVLRACRDASPRPRRVVVTSSFATIGYGVARPADYRFTEADHTDPDGPGVGAYVRSKCLAEAAAREFVAGLPPAQALELVTVHPTLVLGPTLGGRVDSGSAEIVGRLLRGEIPALARVPVNAVDVRDVALVHVAAMTHAAAAGERFLVSGAALTLDQLGPPLAAAFAPLGYRVPWFVAPDFLLRLAAWVDADAAAAASQLGKPKLADATTAAALFGLTFNADFAALAVDLGRGLIAAGQVPDRSPGLVLSVHLPPPARDALSAPRFPPALSRLALPPAT